MIENVVKIIDALAWPVVVLILAFGFRSELRKILARLSKFKYKDLEAAVGQIAEKMGMNSSNPLNGMKALRFLVKEERVDASLWEDYNRLRNLRNAAAHAEEFEISKTEAERYSALAIEIAGFLKRFAKNTS